jgi:maleylpyruvate isomerase
MTVDVPSDIGAVAASHEALLRSIAHLDDALIRQPSLLPGWSVGHVLTHVARNADGLANLARWARTGVRTPMYESRDRRDADIEAGSGRGAAEMRADLIAAQQRFLDSLAGIADLEVRYPVTYGKGDRVATAEELPLIRMSEVEIHHVDLDLGYTPAHWPESFVERMLSRVCDEFGDRDVPGVTLLGVDDERTWTIGDGAHVVTGPAPALLAWLVGRTDGTGLHADGGVLPALGAWR